MSNVDFRRDFNAAADEIFIQLSYREDSYVSTLFLKIKQTIWQEIAQQHQDAFEKASYDDKLAVDELVKAALERGGIKCWLLSLDENKKLSGPFERYDSQGSVHSESWYKNGDLQAYKVYSPEGLVMKTSANVRGCEEKTIFKYYDDKVLQQKIQFKDDVLHGSFVSYYPDGALKFKGEYKDGYLSKIVEAYDCKGNPAANVAHIAYANENEALNYGAQVPYRLN